MQADICTSRHRGNSESTVANLRTAPNKFEDRERILRFVRECGANGATTEEISRGLGMPYTTASPRVSELKADGWLIKIGTRPTSTGSPAAVLRVLTLQEHATGQLDLL